MAEYVGAVFDLISAGDFSGCVKVDVNGCRFAAAVAEGLRVRGGDTVIVEDGGSNPLTIDGREYNVPYTVTKVVKGEDYEEFAVGDELTADETRELPDGAVVLSLGSMNGRYVYSVYSVDADEDYVLYGLGEGNTVCELNPELGPFKVIWLGAPWAAKEEN